MVTKNSIVNYQGPNYNIGCGPTGFEMGKGYKVVAGFGDGVPRNDGTVGGFIQSETQFVVVDEQGNYRQQSSTNGLWVLVHAAPNLNPVKPDKASPV